MVESVGVDIVEVDRIRAAVRRWGQKFLKRVFTSGEIEYCMAQRHRYTSLAARFAAKEAVSKAIAPKMAIRWTDVEIVRSHRGKPEVKVRGKAAEATTGKKILLSLSHTQSYAVAVAVLRRN
ncbi:MAG: holo-ACP synthase [Candidatus Latescibacteria bacterium]|nr:holo-ACP synthase [Candidatus Latescibacterota bacterium]